VLLWSSESGEVPEPSSNPTLVAQPCCICQHPKLIQGHHVGVGLTLADHQPPPGLRTRRSSRSARSLSGTSPRVATK
jgi:hypothetical protein